MFEWRRGRGLRIFLLPGKLNLRHRRNARNLRTLPAHGCYFQHWGECRVLSIGPNGPSLSPLRRPTVLFLCRERPLWREACSASRRESPRRFSRPSAAATSSRGWSRRSVSETNPQQVAPLTFSYSRLSAPFKGAGRVLHQPRHLHRGTDQPRHHRRCGAGAHTLPQQVRNILSVMIPLYWCCANRC